MSRDLIPDSVEVVLHAERMDGLVGIAGCDKSEPGMRHRVLQGVGRAHRPTAARGGWLGQIPDEVRPPSGPLRGSGRWSARWGKRRPRW